MDQRSRRLQFQINFKIYLELVDPFHHTVSHVGYLCVFVLNLHFPLHYLKLDVVSTALYLADRLCSLLIDAGHNLFFHLLKIIEEPIVFLDDLSEVTETIFIFESFPDDFRIFFNYSHFMNNSRCIKFMQRNQRRVPIDGELLEQLYLLKVHLIGGLKPQNLTIVPDSHCRQTVINDGLRLRVYIFGRLEKPHINIFHVFIHDLLLEHLLPQVAYIFHVVIAHTLHGLVLRLNFTLMLLYLMIFLF